MGLRVAELGSPDAGLSPGSPFGARSSRTMAATQAAGSGPVDSSMLDTPDVPAIVQATRGLPPLGRSSA